VQRMAVWVAYQGRLAAASPSRGGVFANAQYFGLARCGGPSKSASGKRKTHFFAGAAHNNRAFSRKFAQKGVIGLGPRSAMPAKEVVPHNDIFRPLRQRVLHVLGFGLQKKTEFFTLRRKLF